MHNNLNVLCSQYNIQKFVINSPKSSCFMFHFILFSICIIWISFITKHVLLNVVLDQYTKFEIPYVFNITSNFFLNYQFSKNFLFLFSFHFAFYVHHLNIFHHKACWKCCLSLPMVGGVIKFYDIMIN